jgi:hypothetical protein
MEIDSSIEVDYGRPGVERATSHGGGQPRRNDGKHGRGDFGAFLIAPRAPGPGSVAAAVMD